MPSSPSRLATRPAEGATEPSPARSERRRESRIPCSPAAQPVPGALTIVDVSAFGCCVRHADPAIGPGHFIALGFASLGAITGYVRWREGGNIGVEFCRALAPGVEGVISGEEILESVRRL